jgi:hypothetical protein
LLFLVAFYSSVGHGRGLPCINGTLGHSTGSNETHALLLNLFVSLTSFINSTATGTSTGEYFAFAVASVPWPLWED